MKELLKELIDFSHRATPSEFKEVFGEHISTHLWNKFSFKYKYDLIRFVNTLDEENFTKLTEYLTKETLVA